MSNVVGISNADCTSVRNPLTCCAFLHRWRRQTPPRSLPIRTIHTRHCNANQANVWTPQIPARRHGPCSSLKARHHTRKHVHMSIVMSTCRRNFNCLMRGVLSREQRASLCCLHHILNHLALRLPFFNTPNMLRAFAMWARCELVCREPHAALITYLGRHNQSCVVMTMSTDIAANATWPRHGYNVQCYDMHAANHSGMGDVASACRAMKLKHKAEPSCEATWQRGRAAARRRTELVAPHGVRTPTTLVVRRRMIGQQLGDTQINTAEPCGTQHNA